MQTLTFQDISLTPVKQDTQIWLTSSDLAKALDYANTQSVTKIYERNADEFTSSMTTIAEVKTKGGLQRVRIFSLRGCHLIAMFARTKVAKEFRQWVLDILDKEVSQPVQVEQSDSHQSEQPFNIKDYLNQKSNQVMDYVHSLEHIVFNATGKYPQRPFKPDEIAKGIIGHCLNTQTIELNFSERGLGFNLVDRTMLRIHDSNIAEHIKNGNVSKKYLDEIIQASVARLA